MSKINAFRLINLNYNNNAIRISDETFHLNGESTLLSLRNGGGKSVLVQMITAPFVHKRYRDAKDRPFESYFTTNKPSFILVEWALDQGAGYVLTGMMVRRSQEITQNGENLEMVNLISEYKEPCMQDIHHLPVVEKGKREMLLKNFSVCRQLFESFKKDREVPFFCYDMNNGAQSRQYFEKLKEYQINYKEWETIIKKVNLKESGLSDLFADCRDEKGLVEKWFLDAVESKLNREKNRMKEFQNILEKYVGQYKDNQSKIRRRDHIRRFQEEASGIRERAGQGQAAQQEKREMENQVACFLEILNQLLAGEEEKERMLTESMEKLQEEIAYVEYEKLSGKIYELRDQERFHTGNREMIGMERDGLEQECEKISHILHVLECARVQEETDEEHAELVRARQKLEVSRKKEEDLEPERKSLGYTLKQHYQKEILENEEKSEKNQALLLENQDQIRAEKEKREALQGEILEKTARQGALKSRIAVYDEKEGEFCGRYQESLIRNILGEYEPGELEIRREAYRTGVETTVRERTLAKKQLDSAREKQRGLERTLEDLRERIIRSQAETEKEEQTEALYQKELQERRVILRYLNLGEEDLLDREKILQTAGRKLLELESLRRNLEKEEDQLQTEYTRLTQGRVLELPQEFETMLQGLGIRCVYGMDWLKKNGNSAGENQELVRRHPFLPYALILSKRELEKLSAHRGEVYTSFPVPLMVREDLESEGEACKDRLISLPGISFYVLFNENLLDEKTLQSLIQEKEFLIRRKQEAIETRREEYRDYFEKQERVRSQEVDPERLEKLRLHLEELAAEQKELTGERQRTEEACAEGRNLMERLEQEILEKDRSVEFQNRRLEDYDRLCQSYASYLESRRELESCKKETGRLTEQKKRSEELGEKLSERQKTLESEEDLLLRRLSRQREQLLIYRDCEEAPLAKGEPQELEARYQALTSGISKELRDLEERVQYAGKRFEKSSENLEYLRKKFGLRKGEWEQTAYSRKEEVHQERLLEEKRQRAALKGQLWNEEDKKAAIVIHQLKLCMEELKSAHEKEEPLPREAIQTKDFSARIRQLSYRKKEEQKKAEAIGRKIRSYEENLTALSEYEGFPKIREVEWDQDFRQMDSQQLRSFKGMLIRDYNQSLAKMRQAREALVQLLNRVVRMEVFQEDFYRKPLEALLELTADPDQVIAQLAVTTQSYQSLMEKLEIDISLVEKEKEKIAELLEDYIREVHTNLGRIDQNSTITVRERPIKMLKLQLPDWEENVSLYRIRLEDTIDEITKRGIQLFEENENAQEYFGIQMTTKNLYDTVVGIGNLQIRLYKIEEQREYPITWAEVAKNSGGEGFLSAFIILSSLLYYMRRDDTDLFAERNEGKVLIMDNPFAQTNAAHLLKPLMDMAKKTNTQLICLSGLGGESIYSRFDNIYVLNLIAASLRNGMQYLRAEHRRGSEPDTMIASRIQVAEQQELLF